MVCNNVDFVSTKINYNVAASPCDATLPMPARRSANLKTGQRQWRNKGESQNLIPALLTPLFDNFILAKWARIRLSAKARFKG
jgi:hypothetical protein